MPQQPPSMADLDQKMGCTEEHCYVSMSHLN